MNLNIDIPQEARSAMNQYMKLNINQTNKKSITIKKVGDGSSKEKQKKMQTNFQERIEKLF